MSVWQHTAGIFFIPVNHFFYPRKALIQCAGGVHLAIIGRHHLSLMHHILFSQPGRIYLQLMCQLIYCRLQSMNSLRCTKASKCSSRLKIGVHHVGIKAIGIQFSIERDRLVSAQSNRRCGMLPVGAGIGQGVHMYAANVPVFRCTHSQVNLHFMTGTATGCRFFPIIDDHRRTAGHPGNDGRIRLCLHRLFRTKSSADAGFHNADFALWNVQRIGNNAANMKGNLGGGHKIQSAEGV